MSIFNDSSRIPQSYGLRIAAGLIIYFVVMHLAGFSHHVELRLFNLIILVAGVYFALKKFKVSHADHLNYFRALITGVATGAIGSFIFAIFFFAYMKLDSSLMQSIAENEPMGRYLNPFIAAFIIALEGLFSSLLVTFILINFVNTDDVNDPVDNRP